MKVSDYIVSFLENRGCRYIFGYIGGAITHLIDSVSRNERVSFVQVYHEQTAAFAAEGFSRSGDCIGVATATSGPGATNLVTGIADAYFDSIPVLYITGQVNTYEYKYLKPVRQQGFQETDIVSIVRPITKYSALVDDKDAIRFELEKAVSIAMSGRPGPVLLDIPMDIQRAEVDPAALAGYTRDDLAASSAELDTNLIRGFLAASKRPVILSGGGVLSARARDNLHRFATAYSIPVVVSLMGKGSFPEDHDLFVGMIGSYGNRCANMVLANSDLLFAVGTRLDTRQTGTRLDSFLRRGRIVHVDIDEFEVTHNRLKRDYAVSMDAKSFFDILLKDMDAGYACDPAWTGYVRDIREQYSQKNEVEKNVEVKIPYAVMNMLNRHADDSTVYCVDIGQNQMFAAQSLVIRGGQRFYTSGGMAPMGYAVPAAIGASFACGHSKNMIAIVGDGGFHISTQSLMLLSQYDLPIKVVVLNNRSLGMIVQFQDLYFNHNEVATTGPGGYRVPIIRDMAASYGLRYVPIDEKNLDDHDLWKDIAASRKPMIVEVVIESKTIVSPKLEVNRPIEDLSPRISEGEMKKIMISERDDD